MPDSSPTPTISRFAGADWIRSAFKPEPVMSPLGIAVADLLGDVFAGIYHLNPTSLRRVDWTNPSHIACNIDRTLSTFDFAELTYLVVLCHDRCIRFSLAGNGPRHMEMLFHQRQREGSVSRRHPTMEDAIQSIRSSYPGVPVPTIPVGSLIADRYSTAAAVASAAPITTPMQP